MYLTNKCFVKRLRSSSIVSKAFLPCNHWAKLCCLNILGRDLMKKRSSLQILETGHIQGLKKKIWLLSEIEGSNSVPLPTSVSPHFPFSFQNSKAFAKTMGHVVVATKRSSFQWEELLGAEVRSSHSFENWAFLQQGRLPFPLMILDQLCVVIDDFIVFSAELWGDFHAQACKNQIL